MNYQIYVDMDGVLCDFNKAFEELGYGPENQFDGKSDEFYKILYHAGEKFWSQMSWIPDGKKLWQFIKPYKPIILSTPTFDNFSRTGKVKWIQKELSMKQKYILEFKKEIHANPDSILIDDRIKNIMKWKDAGGIGILHKDANKTIIELKKYLGI